MDQSYLGPSRDPEVDADAGIPSPSAAGARILVWMDGV